MKKNEEENMELKIFKQSHDIINYNYISKEADKKKVREFPQRSRYKFIYSTFDLPHA